MNLSARNQLKGRITSLRVEGLTAEVEVDVGGQTVASTITAASTKRLGLAVGDQVLAIIKASDVMIAK